VARSKASTLILEAVDFELASSTCPIFLLGDLNSPESDTAYRTISSKMYDLRYTSAATFGHKNTFTGFDGKPSDLSRIDYIFGTQYHGWKGGVYAVEENHFEDKKWLSDHRLVIADVTLGPSFIPAPRAEK
jgi:endonuclease/exonuclease/phosphatase family metal-dependent hydrolase